MGSKLSKNKDKSEKKKDAKKSMKAEETEAEQKVEETPTQEKKVEEPKKEEAPVEEKKEEAPVEEKKVDEAAPAEEKKEETAPVEEKKEETAPVEEKKEETAPVEEKKEETAPVEEKKEETAPVEEKKEETAPVEEKKEETAPVEEKKEEVAVAAVVPVEEKKEEAPKAALPPGALDQAALDTLFHSAFTAHGFTQDDDKKVTVEQIEEAIKLALMGPTSFNCSPLRVCIISTPEGKAKYIEAVEKDAPGNKFQSETAHVNLIVALDKTFEDKLGFLMPAVPNASSYFKGDNHDAVMNLNGGLQAGYLIMALRALGLNVGPQITGKHINEAFGLSGENDEWVGIFTINVGYDLADKRYPRAPRFSANSEQSAVDANPNSVAIRR